MIISTLQQQFPSFAINGDGSTISLLSLAIFIVAIIARYMLFIKMGEEGWKSLIPFYNRYVLFEKCWKGSYFIISLAAIIPAVVLAAAAFAVFETRPEIAILLGCIAAVSIMVALVINLILAYKLSRAFGHGILFTIGFLCMTNIFTMILGFGRDSFQSSSFDDTAGPADKADHADAAGAPGIAESI